MLSGTWLYGRAAGAGTTPCSRHAKRATRLLNNEFNIGRLVWNRQRLMKNPDKGKRVARISQPEERIVAHVPELRILDAVLWHVAKARQREPAERYATAFAATRNACISRMNVVHRSRYLFSGPLECGICGGPCAIRGGAAMPAPTTS